MKNIICYSLLASISVEIDDLWIDEFPHVEIAFLVLVLNSIPPLDIFPTLENHVDTSLGICPEISIHSVVKPS
jgi:hypothetical protein